MTEPLTNSHKVEAPSDEKPTEVWRCHCTSCGKQPDIPAIHMVRDRYCKIEGGVTKHYIVMAPRKSTQNEAQREFLRQCDHFGSLGFIPCVPRAVLVVAP